MKSDKLRFSSGPLHNVAIIAETGSIINLTNIDKIPPQHLIDYSVICYDTRFPVVSPSL